MKQQPEPAPRSRSPQSTVTRRKLSSQLATDLFQPIALATEEKTVFELDPIMRSVPTTISKITATITAYSAMSWPSSDKVENSIGALGDAAFLLKIFPSLLL